jgi:hypothetical protein
MARLTDFHRQHYSGYPNLYKSCVLCPRCTFGFQIMAIPTFYLAAGTTYGR